MAKNVQAQVMGRSIQTNLEGTTVQSILDQMDVSSSMTAMVNGEPADLSDSIKDYDFITFSKNVDGGKL